MVMSPDQYIILLAVWKKKKNGCDNNSAFLKSWKSFNSKRSEKGHVGLCFFSGWPPAALDALPSLTIEKRHRRSGKKNKKKTLCYYRSFSNTSMLFLCLNLTKCNQSFPKANHTSFVPKLVMFLMAKVQQSNQGLVSQTAMTDGNLVHMDMTWRAQHDVMHCWKTVLYTEHSMTTKN